MTELAKFLFTEIASMGNRVKIEKASTNTIITETKIIAVKKILNFKLLFWKNIKKFLYFICLHYCN